MSKPEQIKYFSLSNEVGLDEPYNIQPWQRFSFQCAKTFVLIFNGFFWLLGWTLIGVGISLQGSVGTHEHLSSRNYENSVTNVKEYGGYSSAGELCLCIGCIITVVVLLACCGTHAENHLVLGIYLAVVVILLSFEIAAIAVVTFHKEKVERRIIRDIKLTMNFYEVKTFEGITRSIDSFQKVFHCCGCIDYTDWFNTTWGKHHKMNVPDSCLKNNSTWLEGTQQQRMDPFATVSSINTKGCFKYVRNYFVKNLHFFRTFVASILGIQIIGLAFSICLFCKYKNYKTRITSHYRAAFDNEP